MRATIVSVAIAVFILASIGNAAVSVVGNFWNRGDNTFSRIPHYYAEAEARTCEAPERPDGDENRLVVLRIDDPQAYVWTGTVERMVGDTGAHGWRPVLGIIPNHLEEDEAFSTFLAEHACEFETAQHGYAHNRDGDYDTPEFDGIGEEEAREKLRMGRDILERVTGESVSTFIPPQNRVDPDIGHLFKKMGYAIFSGLGEGTYDSDISSYDFEHDRLIPVEDILAGCEERFETGNACVIMLHPQDYATDGITDPEKYRLFTDLLDGLESRDASVVTFKELRKILAERDIP